MDVKISIITVVYNAVGKIEPTILSVLRQTYGNIEYIVVDGGSTDGTIELIGKYRDRIAVVVSERDDGIYDALNKGVKLATGDWVGIMNAGDVYADDDVLARIFAGGNIGEECDVIYGDSIAVDDERELYCRAPDSVEELSVRPVYRHGASFVKRIVHDRYLFDLTKKPMLDFALDYEQIFRMYKGGSVFCRVPVAVIKYELRGASTVSPFLGTYYNYLITHRMKCGSVMKIVLFWLTLWRGLIVVITRFWEKRFDSHKG